MNYARFGKVLDANSEYIVLNFFGVSFETKSRKNTSQHRKTETFTIHQINSTSFSTF